MLLSGCAGNTVTIGQQVWMSDNVNKAMKGARCYKKSNDGKPCADNNMVYTWESAIHACPAGFHLPSKQDFLTLEKNRIKNKDIISFGCFGNDKTSSGGFCYETAFSAYWTSSEADKKNAFVWDVDFSYKFFESKTDNKNEYYAVRCIQD